MIWFQRFYLDKEKDIIVDLYKEGEELCYVLQTPNHHTGNLITNLARVCGLPVSFDEKGQMVFKSEDDQKPAENKPALIVVGTDEKLEAIA